MAATIQSLERGLQILDILGKSGKPLSLNELAEHFTIDRSSVFRLVSTLLKCGYVVQDDSTKQYSLSYKVLELSSVFTRQSNIEGLIRPIIDEVIQETNQNTHLAVLDGDQVVFLMVEHPKDHLALNISIGLREPAMVTALGKSLLAYQNSEILDRMLSSHVFVKYTDKSATSSSQIRKSLARVKKDLFAMDDEEYRPGIMCIAAPVFNNKSEVQFSIGISGLKEVIKPNLKAYQKAVRDAGIKASKFLGYNH